MGTHGRDAYPSAMESKRHWEAVYATKQPHQVSWYQAEPTLSLRLVDECAGQRPTSVIDVGGGASGLVDRLLDRPSTDVTVLDLSGTALHTAQKRFGLKAGRVKWVEADILAAELPGAAYDVWHDRAVFHFLTDAEDRRRYVDQVRRSVRPGGHVLVATFGVDWAGEMQRTSGRAVCAGGTPRPVWPAVSTDPKRARGPHHADGRDPAIRLLPLLNGEPGTG